MVGWDCDWSLGALSLGLTGLGRSRGGVMVLVYGILRFALPFYLFWILPVWTPLGTFLFLDGHLFFFAYLRLRLFWCDPAVFLCTWRLRIKSIHVLYRRSPHSSQPTATPPLFSSASRTAEGGDRWRLGRTAVICHVGCFLAGYCKSQLLLHCRGWLAEAS